MTVISPMKPVLATAAAILLAAAVAGCGPVMRFMAGGAKNAAAGVWSFEPEEDLGIRWLALDPQATGDEVSVQYEIGITCTWVTGTIRGNRLVFWYEEADVYVEITIQSSRTATLVFLGVLTKTTFRLRKTGPERSLICQ